MAVWRIRRSSSPFFSDWRPAGAGQRTFQCEFLSPSEGARVGADHRGLQIEVQVQAGYEASNASGFIPYQGQGVTAAKLALRRPNVVWTSAGWIQVDPKVALSWSSIPISPTRWEATSPQGDVALIFDVDIDVESLGVDWFDVQLYVEGHPLSNGPHDFGSSRWRNRFAGAWTHTVHVDDAPPETNITFVSPAGSQPLVLGNASDDNAVKRVHVLVSDPHRGVFWHDDHGWSTRQEANLVDVHPNGGWAYFFPEGANPGSGRYEVTAWAEDTAIRARTRTNRQGYGNLDPTPATDVIHRTAARPEVEIDLHEDDVVDDGDQIAGRVEDDGAVATVRVEIVDRERPAVEGQVWNPTTGTWQADLAGDDAIQAQLAGERHWDVLDKWTYSWTAAFAEPVGGTGHYTLSVVATDLEGNEGSTEVDVFGRDGLEPHITVLRPDDGEVFDSFIDLNSTVEMQVIVKDDRDQTLGDVLVSFLNRHGEWYDLMAQEWRSTRTETSMWQPWVQSQQVVRYTEPRFQPLRESPTPIKELYRVHFVPIDSQGNRGTEVSIPFVIDHRAP